MSLQVKSGGVMRTLKSLQVKSGGALRTLKSLQVKSGGVLRELLVQYFSPWSGRQILDFTSSGTRMTSFINITTAGLVVSSSGTVGGAWINPTALAAGHQASYTVITAPTAGLDVSAPAAGVWLPSAALYIEISNNGASYYSGEMRVKIQIRRTIDNAIVCDGSVLLAVTREM